MSAVIDRSDPRGGYLFAAMLAAFAAIYLVFYPRTYANHDEARELSLAFSIEHGSIFPDHAGPSAGLQVGPHVVSVYSPFHAAMFAPALASDWRLAFLVTAAFFAVGAFTVRATLVRDGLSADWSALYFMLAGALYYSRTLMAAIPAAVLALAAVSMLTRPQPRPIVAGLTFGLSVLMHPWMAPMAIVFSAVWCIERGLKSFLANLSSIAIGALPCVVALAAYNYITLGNPLHNVYAVLGAQDSFTGAHLFSFFLFYAVSLAIFPLAGWAVFSPRWSRGWALPVTAAVMVALASLYYYRDGLNVGSARVGIVAGLAAGFIPGQRFLLPVSMLACLPAARFLSSRLSEQAQSWQRALRPAALVTFVTGFIVLSAAHQAYLDAHARLQQALWLALPGNAEVALGSELELDDLGKELAPVERAYNGAHDTLHVPAATAYVAYLALPGNRPPEGWLDGRRAELVRIRSWAWNRDLWIGDPASETAHSTSR